MTARMAGFYPEVMLRLGGAESDEGIEVFGGTKGSLWCSTNTTFIWHRDAHGQFRQAFKNLENNSTAKFKV